MRLGFNGSQNERSVMRDLTPPFKFDLRSLLKQARQKVNTRVDGVAVNLPFISFNVKPDDLEKKVAREIVIRLADRRVLNAFECCDNCIEQALASLQKIRSMLVDKQVELTKLTESPLYLMIEFMLEGIRQFLTFEQRLKDRAAASPLELPRHADFHRPADTREAYFAALEMLRAHLHRSLLQISKIAAIPIPKIADNMRYDEAWKLDAYERPLLSE
jgi:hypothetical protein